MKKTLIAASAAVLLATSACATDADEASPSQPVPVAESVAETEPLFTATPQATAPPLSEKEIGEQAFLAVISEYGINLPEDRALQIGNDTCLFLSNGGTVEDLIDDLASRPYDRMVPELSNFDLPYVQGAAVGAMCPEYDQELS